MTAVENRLGHIGFRQTRYAQELVQLYARQREVIQAI
jgi:hypothetical protein